ncbi:hypoxia up-regulated 1 [Kwoniella heveanensis BCC8398]|uniref:Hypoxia up-regulated 1 n=1 Tax=Kwoniella heveanensis BCC8398 TaxID=1296120 RepID=A0A1B9GZI7_9TREE|nr:hypoxia up-regulated 1 [Kwoniella heveanensis BCC8398]
MRPNHLLSLLLLLLAPAIQAAVLAIDYGAEFTKLSLVKPGVPFDVVLDKDSKRKISSVVGWKRDDRVFGAEAKMAATRFPDTHFPYVKPLLGSTSPSQLPVHPNPPSLTSDGVLIFPHPSPPSHVSPSPESHDQVWTPTALLAHQIAYYRHLAETLVPSGSAPEPINQVIVTVPAWWDHYQRKAYRDALELQGLSCLAMIGEGTGVALNYAMTRSFPDFNLETGLGQKEYHVIYDSGALSTTATVLALYQTSYLPTPKSKTPINTTHIEVLGVGYEQVGGVILDVAVQDLLMADFVSKSGQKGVTSDKKAKAKIAREANRVKHILSANQEANVAIESLYNDVDYRSKVSRAALESSVESSIPFFSHPITSALSSANLTLSEINSVILFGGNTRVPLVQSALKSALGGTDDKIAQNVNTDEAAVLGAAYYGAALSRTFKMKNLNVTERSVWDVTMGDEVIFPSGTRLGEKKVLTFPADKVASAGLQLEFAQSTHTSPSQSVSKAESQVAQSKPILAVNVLDIQSALSNFTAPSPVVQVTMRLDPRGYLSVANAVLTTNALDTEKEGGMAGALKGLFGNGKKDKDASGEEEDEAEGDAVDSKKEKTAKPPKVALKFREKHVGIRPMTSEEKRTTQARLTSIAAFESAKFAREEARNLLEGYLYRLSGLLSDDAENKALHEFATEQEKKTLRKSVDETMEWLGEEAERADEKTLRQKRADLEALEAPVIFRFSEYQVRGKSIEDFQQAMFASRSFLVEARANYTAALKAAESATPENPVAPPKYTEEELKNVEDMMKDNEVWMDRLMQDQVKIDASGDKTKDPVITSKELDERGKRLQTTVLRLMSKKAPRRPKPNPGSSSTAHASPTHSGPEVRESTHADADSSSSATYTSHASPTDKGPDVRESTHTEEASGSVSSTTLASPTDHGPTPKVVAHEEL